MLHPWDPDLNINTQLVINKVGRSLLLNPEHCHARPYSEQVVQLLLQLQIDGVVVDDNVGGPVVERVLVP